MIPLKEIKNWLLHEYKLSYEAFKNYFLIAFACLFVSFFIINLFWGFNLGTVRKLMISKSGLGISLTAVISFLSSQIRQNDLIETRKRFLTKFGTSEKCVEKEINDMILNIATEKLTAKKEEDGK